MSDDSDLILDTFANWKRTKNPKLLKELQTWTRDAGVSFNTLGQRLARRQLAFTSATKSPFQKIPQRQAQGGDPEAYANGHVCPVCGSAYPQGPSCPNCGDDNLMEAAESKGPKPTQDEVKEFLTRSPHSSGSHYLYDKHPDTWDEYDFSNWRSMKGKEGRPFLYGRKGQKVRYDDLSPTYKAEINRNLEAFLRKRITQGPLSAEERLQASRMTGLIPQDLDHLCNAILTRGPSRSNMVLAQHGSKEHRSKLITGIEGTLERCQMQGVSPQKVREIIDTKRVKLEALDTESLEYIARKLSELFNDRKGQAAAMNPPAQMGYSTSVSTTGQTSSTQNAGQQTAPPKPTTMPPFGKKYVLDPSTNTWLLVPTTDTTPA